MTMGDRPARTAQEALDQLREALREAGIGLPSLRIDPISAAQGHPFALIDLGRCNLGVASQLAAALRRTGGDAG
ncbi:hypothetical protein [Streptomyces sp. NPDC001388]|uniref:hypothetical protein n=1 Tax=unclassified Streptomyces TaxID=2593676 RepID=UPI00369AA616